MDIRMWLKIFKRILFHPRCLKKLSNKTETYRNYLIEKYGEHLELKAISPFDILDKIDVEVCPTVASSIGLEYLGRAVLIALAQSYKNCDCLEIGTYLGGTTASLANVCKSVTTVDIRNFDIKHHKNNDNVRAVLIDSMKLDWKTLGKFDLIFIDGDHGYDAVRSDTKNAFEVLKPGGIIIWDDYIDRESAYNLPQFIEWDIFAGILDGCPEMKRKCLYSLAGTDVAIYIEGDFNLIDYPTFKFKSRIVLEEDKNNGVV